MNGYRDISPGVGYRLVNHGPVVLVSTCSDEERFNLAPVAWNCPVSKTPPKVLIAVGKKHVTAGNIKKTGEFALCVPGKNQISLVKNTGTVSAKEIDKFEKFSIKYEMAEKINARIPKGCVGYMECRLTEEYDAGHVYLFVGQIISAGAVEEGFSDRVLVEKEEGKTLHHLGNKVFAIPGEISKGE